MSDPNEVITALRRMLIVKEREAADLVEQVTQLTAQLSERAKSPIAGSQPAAQSDGGPVEVDDVLVLQEVGLYEYHHPLENAAAYQEQLRYLRARIRSKVVDGDAIDVGKQFSFNNSVAEGRRLTRDLSKLMLRAYNAEAENCVRTIRAGNLQTARKRLDKAAADIERLGAAMHLRVDSGYHELRITELELTADYQAKVQEERDAARDERERLREERKVAEELARRRQELDKEREHYRNVLRRVTDPSERAEAEAAVARIDEAIAENDYRAANIRAGYVYVISNVGAFGSNVVKIGLTRRLEPLDRVRELGGASVPFPFDVHALYFSDDAVTLENELHKEFGDKRLNHVNLRREFFYATPDEVRNVLATKVGNLLEFTSDPEATQYYQSLKYRSDSV